jgi:hypothetical protein
MVQKYFLSTKDFSWCLKLSAFSEPLHNCECIQFWNDAMLNPHLLCVTIHFLWLMMMESHFRRVAPRSYDVNCLQTSSSRDGLLTSSVCLHPIGLLPSWSLVLGSSITIWKRVSMWIILEKMKNNLKIKSLKYHD